MVRDAASENIEALTERRVTMQRCDAEIIEFLARVKEGRATPDGHRKRFASAKAMAEELGLLDISRPLAFQDVTDRMRDVLRRISKMREQLLDTTLAVGDLPSLCKAIQIIQRWQTEVAASITRMEIL